MSKVPNKAWSIISNKKPWGVVQKTFPLAVALFPQLNNKMNFITSPLALSTVFNSYFHDRLEPTHIYLAVNLSKAPKAVNVAFCSLAFSIPLKFFLSISRLKMRIV